MKTPIMELIEELKKEQLAFCKSRVPCLGIDRAIEMAESKLFKERYEFEDAYRDGISNTFFTITHEKDFELTPDQWFIEKFVK